MNESEKRQLNFIAVIGFLLSILSIPFFLFFAGQILSLALSILGYADCVKCNNRGRGFAVLGTLISSILLIAAPVTIIVCMKNGIGLADADILTILRVVRILL